MPVEREIKGQDHSLRGMGESQHGPGYRPGSWASTLPHACLDRVGGRLPDHRWAPQLWPNHPENPGRHLPDHGREAVPMEQTVWVGPQPPSPGRRCQELGTHRSLPVGVGEDSVDLHVAPVGLSHVHPQLPAARLAGAVQTRHIVVVVVLLAAPKTEPTGGVRGQACQEPPSARPTPRPPDTRNPGPPRGWTGAPSGWRRPGSPWTSLGPQKLSTWPLTVSTQLQPQPDPHLLSSGSALPFPERPRASPAARPREAPQGRARPEAPKRNRPLFPGSSQTEGESSPALEIIYILYI